MYDHDNSFAHSHNRSVVNVSPQISTLVHKRKRSIATDLYLSTYIKKKVHCKSVIHCYTWQNFLLRLLHLVNNCIEFIYKTQKSKTKVMPCVTVGKKYFRGRIFVHMIHTANLHTNHIQMTLPSTHLFAGKCARTLIVCDFLYVGPIFAKFLHINC